MSAPRLSLICRPPGLATPLHCRIRPLAPRNCARPSLAPSSSALRFYVQISHKASHRQVQAAVTINVSPALMRLKSTMASKKGKPPPPTIGQILRHIFRFSFGNLGRAFTGPKWKEAWRENPEGMIFAIGILVCMVPIIGYIIWLYFNYFYGPQFTRLPDPVAKSMRRALYYSDHAPDPKQALKYYNLALQQCVEAGLDPFADEFTGIRIKLAAWLEGLHKFDNSIEVLETLLSDCRRWVEVMERAVADGTAPDFPSAPYLYLSGSNEAGKANAKAAAAALTAKAASAGDAGAGGQEADAAQAVVVVEPREATEEDLKNRETIWGKRTRVLRKAISIGVKLGELYSDEHVLQQDLAHEKLVWAVELSLKEMQRRATEKRKPGEGPWLSAEEIGGALEALGNSFLTKERPQLAVPLFFQALHLCRDPCHTAVINLISWIVNNLAATFVQHPYYGPGAVLLANDLAAAISRSRQEQDPSAPASEKQQSPAPSGPSSNGNNGGTVPSSPEETRAMFLDYANNWAQNAQRLSAETKGERRTPECDEACAVSLYNLGDIARLLGNTAEARRRFGECAEMSKTLGFKAGIEKAEAGLRGLA